MPITDDRGNLIVTLADVWQDQNEIRQTVTSGFTGISAQLSTISSTIGGVTETQAAHNLRVEDHESRLRNLERFRNAFPAVLLTSVLSLIAVIADIVVRIINHG